MSTVILLTSACNLTVTIPDHAEGIFLAWSTVKSFFIIKKEKVKDLNFLKNA